MNGDRSETFLPSRGLRQGDPLFPYLFVICADGLSTMIKDAARNGKLNGVSVCKNVPKMTHFFFFF